MIRPVLVLALAGALFLVAAVALFGMGSGPGAFYGMLGFGLIGLVLFVVALIILCLSTWQR